MGYSLRVELLKRLLRWAFLPARPGCLQDAAAATTGAAGNNSIYSPRGGQQAAALDDSSIAASTDRLRKTLTRRGLAEHRARRIRILAESLSDAASRAPSMTAATVFFSAPGLGEPGLAARLMAPEMAKPGSGLTLMCWVNLDGATLLQGETTLMRLRTHECELDVYLSSGHICLRTAPPGTRHSAVRLATHRSVHSLDSDDDAKSNSGRGAGKGGEPEESADGVVQTCTLVTLPAGKWHHIAVVQDESSLLRSTTTRLFLDGRPVYTSTSFRPVVFGGGGAGTFSFAAADDDLGLAPFAGLATNMCVLRRALEGGLLERIVELGCAENFLLLHHGQIRGEYVPLVDVAIRQSVAFGADPRFYDVAQRVYSTVPHVLITLNPGRTAQIDPATAEIRLRSGTVVAEVTAVFDALTTVGLMRSFVLPGLALAAGVKLSNGTLHLTSHRAPPAAAAAAVTALLQLVENTVARSGVAEEALNTSAFYVIGHILSIARPHELLSPETPLQFFNICMQLVQSSGKSKFAFAQAVRGLFLHPRLWPRATLEACRSALSAFAKMCEVSASARGKLAELGSGRMWARRLVEPMAQQAPALRKAIGDLLAAIWHGNFTDADARQFVSLLHRLARRLSAKAEPITHASPARAETNGSGPALTASASQHRRSSRRANGSAAAARTANIHTLELLVSVLRTCATNAVELIGSRAGLLPSLQLARIGPTVSPLVRCAAIELVGIFVRHSATVQAHLAPSAQVSVGTGGGTATSVEPMSPILTDSAGGGSSGALQCDLSVLGDALAANPLDEEAYTALIHASLSDGRLAVPAFVTVAWQATRDASVPQLSAKALHDAVAIADHSAGALAWGVRGWHRLIPELAFIAAKAPILGTPQGAAVPTDDVDPAAAFGAASDGAMAAAAQWTPAIEQAVFGAMVPTFVYSIQRVALAAEWLDETVTILAQRLNTPGASDYQSGAAARLLAAVAHSWADQRRRQQSLGSPGAGGSSPARDKQSGSGDVKAREAQNVCGLAYLAEAELFHRHVGATATVAAPAQSTLTAGAGSVATASPLVFKFPPSAYQAAAPSSAAAASAPESEDHPADGSPESVRPHSFDDVEQSAAGWVQVEAYKEDASTPLTLCPDTPLGHAHGELCTALIKLFAAAPSLLSVSGGPPVASDAARISLFQPDADDNADAVTTGMTIAHARPGGLRRIAIRVLRAVINAAVHVPRLERGALFGHVLHLTEHFPVIGAAGGGGTGGAATSTGGGAGGRSANALRGFLGFGGASATMADRSEAASIVASCGALAIIDCLMQSIAAIHVHPPAKVSAPSGIALTLPASRAGGLPESSNAATSDARTPATGLVLSTAGSPAVSSVARGAALLNTLKHYVSVHRQPVEALLRDARNRPMAAGEGGAISNSFAGPSASTTASVATVAGGPPSPLNGGGGGKVVKKCQRSFNGRTYVDGMAWLVDPALNDLREFAEAVMQLPDMRVLRREASAAAVRIAELNALVHDDAVARMVNSKAALHQRAVADVIARREQMGVTTTVLDNCHESIEDAMPESEDDNDHHHGDEGEEGEMEHVESGSESDADADTADEMSATATGVVTEPESVSMSNTGNGSTSAPQQRVDALSGSSSSIASPPQRRSTGYAEGLLALASGLGATTSTAAGSGSISAQAPPAALGGVALMSEAEEDILSCAQSDTLRFAAMSRGRLWDENPPDLDPLFVRLSMTEVFRGLCIKLEPNPHGSVYEGLAQRRPATAASPTPSAAVAAVKKTGRFAGEVESSDEDDEGGTSTQRVDPNASIEDDDLTPAELNGQLGGAGGGYTVGGEAGVVEEACEFVYFMEVRGAKLTLTSRLLTLTLDQSNNAYNQFVTPEARKYLPSPTWRTLTIQLADIKEVAHKRRFRMMYTALELRFHDHTSLLLNFPTKKSMETVVAHLVRTLKRRTASVVNPDGRAALKADITRTWVDGSLSTFEYLLLLNFHAGRSVNDMTQYPVMPWVLANYTSDAVDLNDRNNYRDLRLPVGLLGNTERRREEAEARYSNMEEMDQVGQHHSTHYSSPATVMHYLVRLEPFTAMHIVLQSGKFDHADRMFHTVASTWNSVNRNQQDLKELVPELFALPEVLTNRNHVRFGVRQEGPVMDDVILPPWAQNDPRRFVQVMREALESDLVSAELHHWIDLIFGYKQRGRHGVAACNIFHPHAYEPAKRERAAFENMDAQDRRVLVDCLDNIGQCPIQVFVKRHPQRAAPKLANPIEERRVVQRVVPMECNFSRAAICRFSESGKFVAIGSNGAAILFDTAIGTVTRASTTAAATADGDGAAPGVPSTAASIATNAATTTTGGNYLGRLMGGRQGTVTFDAEARCPAFARGAVAFPFDTPPPSVASDYGTGPIRRASDAAVLTSDDGRSVYVAYAGLFDGCCLLRNLRTRTELALSLQRGRVTCVAASPKIGLLVTGSSDTTVNVYRVELRPETIRVTVRTTIEDHEDVITAVACCEHLDLVVSAAADGVLWFHSATTGARLHGRHHPVRGKRIDHLLLVHNAYLPVVCAASHDEDVIHMWSLNGDWLRSVPSFGPLVHWTTTADPRYVLVATRDGTVAFRHAFDLSVALVVVPGLGASGRGQAPQDTTEASTRAALQRQPSMVSAMGFSSTVTALAATATSLYDDGHSTTSSGSTRANRWVSVAAHPRLVQVTAAMTASGQLVCFGPTQ
jgi:WD40 repeat protein